jgi:hypothetical protein
MQQRLANCCTSLTGAVQTWADAAQLKPVALAWLSKQADEVARLMAGVCSRERWEQRPASGETYISSSASEVVRVFNASLTTLTDMGVPLHGSVLRSELELLGGPVRQYAACVTDGCVDPEALVRPPLPLTRYKKELAVKAEAGKDVIRCARTRGRTCLRLHKADSMVTQRCMAACCGCAPSCRAC